MDSKFESSTLNDDGQLEVYTADTLVHMSDGRVNRVGQLGGNVKFYFNERIEGKGNIDTYFEVDGEYYKVRNPKTMEFKLNKRFSNIKLLFNKLASH